MASLPLRDESITYGTVHSGITSRLITSTLKERREAPVAKAILVR